MAPASPGQLLQHQSELNHTSQERVVFGCRLAFNDAMEKAKEMAHITMPAAAIIVQMVMANLGLLELDPTPSGPDPE